MCALSASVFHVPDTRRVSSSRVQSWNSSLCMLRRSADFGRHHTLPGVGTTHVLDSRAAPEPGLALEAWAVGRKGHAAFRRAEFSLQPPHAPGLLWPSPLYRLRDPAEGRRQPPSCPPRNCCPCSRRRSRPARCETGSGKWEANRDSTKANTDASQAF